MQHNHQQSTTTEVKAIILLQIEQVFMHRLLRTDKNLFTSGTLKVAKLQNKNSNNTVYFLNLNSFYYGIHPQIYFIKVFYQDTVAYVFPHFQNGLSAISILANAPEVHNLDEILSNAAELIDYNTAISRPQISKAIEEHYPQLQKEQIYYPDNIKKVITASGKLLSSAFATVGEYLTIGVTKVGEYLNTKIDQGETKHIAPETKQKWDKLKAGTSNILLVSSEYVSKYLEPVVQKTKEYTQGIKEKIDSSQNENVKYAKGRIQVITELAQVSGKAIGEAFQGLLKGGTEVTRELGEQSKKLITKKYGDEVIKTFTGEQKRSENVVASDKKEEEKDIKPKVEEAEDRAEQSDVRLNESRENIYPRLD